ncbi:MAG: hypothetical protein U1F25_03010 [Rubrivivax sp.]
MTNGAVPTLCAATRCAYALALALALGLPAAAQAQFVSPGADVPTGAVVNPAVAAALALQNLPRPATPPPERGEVVPAQVARWREEARSAEYGEGVPRDPLRAAELYCRAARYGDAEAQYSPGVDADQRPRHRAQRRHRGALFARCRREQGHPRARNMAARCWARRWARRRLACARPKPTRWRSSCSSPASRLPRCRPRRRPRRRRAARATACRRSRARCSNGRRSRCRATCRWWRRNTASSRRWCWR